MGAPVVQGQEIDLVIHGMGHGGEGVGRFEGFTVFVPGALIGEHVRARVTQCQKQFAHAKLLEVRSRSNDRIAAPCSVYDACGGCQLQHLSYDGQLRMKRQVVVDALERIGGLRNITVHETIGMETPWHYRNKIVLPLAEQAHTDQAPSDQALTEQALTERPRAGNSDPSAPRAPVTIPANNHESIRPNTPIGQQIVAGYYRQGTHTVVPINQCDIAHPQLEKAVLMLVSIFNDLGIPIYNARTKRGCLRSIMARIAFFTGQLMLVVVTGSRDLSKEKQLIRAVRERLPEATTLVHHVQPRETSENLSGKSRTLFGPGIINERLGELTFHVSAQSFFQVNPIQTVRLYEYAREFAQLSEDDVVVDAHCGTGSIALSVARQVRTVYGFEPVTQAIDDAVRNAQTNNINNAVFTATTAEEGIATLYNKGIQPDVIILDPPRKGCEPALIELLLQHHPRRVVYVSCNPATFARDVSKLVAGGYELGPVQPVDMFPQTAHVECVASTYRVV